MGWASIVRTDFARIIKANIIWWFLNYQTVRGQWSVFNCFCFTVLQLSKMNRRVWAKLGRNHAERLRDKTWILWRKEYFTHEPELNLQYFYLKLWGYWTLSVLCTINYRVANHLTCNWYLPWFVRIIIAWDINFCTKFLNSHGLSAFV